MVAYIHRFAACESLSTHPGPSSLAKEFLLSQFVLVQHDGAQLPLLPFYNCPYLAFERALDLFKLQIGTRTDTVSTQQLKASHAPVGTELALPPTRGRPNAVRADPPEEHHRRGLEKQTGGAGELAGRMTPPEVRGRGSRNTNGRGDLLLHGSALCLQ